MPGQEASLQALVAYGGSYFVHYIIVEQFPSDLPFFFFFFLHASNPPEYLAVVLVLFGVRRCKNGTASICKRLPSEASSANTTGKAPLLS